MGMGRMQKYKKPPQRRAAPRKLATVRTVKSLIARQHELKYTGINVTTDSPLSTGIGTPDANLTGIAQGNSDSTRGGDEVRLKSLDLQYRILQHASATQTLVRVVLVKMKKTLNDLYPDWNDMFLEDDVCSQREHRFKDRLVVIYDRKHLLSSTGNSIAQGHYHKKFDLRTVFNGPNVTDVEQNVIFMYLISNEAVNAPSVIWTSQLSFTDS